MTCIQNINCCGQVFPCLFLRWIDVRLGGQSTFWEYLWCWWVIGHLYLSNVIYISGSTCLELHLLCRNFIISSKLIGSKCKCYLRVLTCWWSPKYRYSFCHQWSTIFHHSTNFSFSESFENLKIYEVINIHSPSLLLLPVDYDIWYFSTWETWALARALKFENLMK